MTVASMARRLLSPYLPTLRRTLLLALTCNALLELVRVIGVAGGPWRFKTPWFPLLFALGSVVVWLVVGLVHAVTGRWWLTRSVMVALTLTVALVDHEKVRLRGEPLYPSDLAFAGQLHLLWGMVGPRALLLAAVVAAVVGGLTVWSRRRERPRAVRAAGSSDADADAGHGSGRDRRPNRLRRPRPADLAVRAAAALLCLLGLLQVSHFNEPGNVARTAYDALGATWRPWSQQRTYLGNGFVGGLLYNMAVSTAPAPPGYDRATMADVVERYRDEADRINRRRTAGALDDVNVVMVLSETLSDPQRLRGVTPAEDPLPFTRELAGRTTSGQVLASGVGGGTANMEFEALTGMSQALLPPQLRVPYQMLVPHHERFPSLVGWLESTGHRPVALHPFTTEMYRRSQVYEAFGFDRFLHDADMPGARRIGHRAYISDAAAFDEAVAGLRRTEQPVFLNLVTMQNHMPYGGRYDDPIPVTGPDGEPMSEIGQYARGLAHTDRALHELLRDLRGLREPTVLVVYGDHLPGAYPDEVMALNGRFAMRQTPFLVWSSFGGRRVQSQLMNTTHLADVMLEHVDAPVPPYLALLTRLRQEAPVLDGGALRAADGTLVPPGDLTPEARRLLHDYRLVQYDLALGHRWSAEAMLTTQVERTGDDQTEAATRRPG